MHGRYVMSVYGGVNALASVMLGYIADTGMGKKLVVCVGALAQLTFYQYFLWMLHWKSLGYFRQHAWQLFVAAGTYGVGDAAFNLVPPALLGALFASRLDVAFAHLKLWQSLGAVVVLLLGPHLDFLSLCIVAVCALMASALALAILNLFVAPIDRLTAEKDPAIN